ncbi:MAG: hypothetical protein WC797_02855, partial [Candidatus Paceibacterota bacterium]
LLLLRRLSSSTSCSSEGICLAMTFLSFFFKPRVVQDTTLFTLGRQQSQRLKIRNNQYFFP